MTGCSSATTTGKPLAWDRATGAPMDAATPDMQPQIAGEIVLPDGRRAYPVFHLLAERYLDGRYAPEVVADTCGIPAATIRRIARELADVAFNQAIELDQPWTDTAGRRHDKMLGRPVAMHAMRGISAHSNGFHTCRAIHLLQMLLGAVDTPGSWRYKSPFPKPIPPGPQPVGKGVEAELHAARHGAGQSARPGRPAAGRRRQRRAHRQGLYVGRADRRARADAHADRQRPCRRSVPDRYAVHVHGQHGLELLDEPRGGRAHDGRQGPGRPANTASRTSSIRMRSSPRRWPMRT